MRRPGSAQSETFKIMERRLLRGIMNPAMIATYLFGFCWLSTPGIVDWSSAWIYAKLALVVGLTGVHMAASPGGRPSPQDRNTPTRALLPVMNEVPTLMMVVIVILVVVKPF